MRFTPANFSYVFAKSFSIAKSSLVGIFTSSPLGATLKLPRISPSNSVSLKASTGSCAATKASNASSFRSGSGFFTSSITFSRSLARKASSTAFKSFCAMTSFLTFCLSILARTVGKFFCRLPPESKDSMSDSCLTITLSKVPLRTSSSSFFSSDLVYLSCTLSLILPSRSAAAVSRGNMPPIRSSRPGAGGAVGAGID